MKCLMPCVGALKKFSVPIMLLLAFALSGCLINERDEYVLKINPDGKTGTLTFIKYNIQSDASDTADQAKDFNDLISNWKSDQYLIDQMEQGAYVKERDVHLEDGKVVRREVSLLADVGNVLPHYREEDTTRFKCNPENGEIVSTNGTVIDMKDSLIVVWPPHTKEFVLRTKVKDFNPKSKFEEKFAEYLRDDAR
jgi:hypothetical protein